MRKRVTMMVITVSVIFGVCWLADSTSYFLGYYTPTHTFGYATTSTMIMFNSAINPIVYALVNQRFREKVKRMMRCGCRPSNRIYAERESQRMDAANSNTNQTLPTRETSKEWFNGHFVAEAPFTQYFPIEHQTITCSRAYYLHVTFGLLTPQPALFPSMQNTFSLLSLSLATWTSY